ncbi:MAG: UDP-N-acetylmuramate dehydrogenase [Dethiobacter sp.]|jgi:UDP-N-acetylmuramate dehydrogenase|nr:UDP-N-acetylmuramate dehydrogenase [Dethiobacter sp.]
MDRIASLLKSEISGNIRTCEPLARYTSFKIGGPADLFIEPVTTAELSAVISLLKLQKIPFFILGNGTNLLIRDSGYRGAAIRLAGEFKKYFYEEGGVNSGSAVPLALLARDACRRRLTNLEFGTGIPGTLGGALFMNAGAHGRSISDVLIDAVILDAEAVLHTYTSAQLGLSYRRSSIGRGSIVCAARLSLLPEEAGKIADRRREYREFRTNRQPRLPNAGSVFKNPPGDAAGRLLEAAGLKGVRVGGAMIADKHANFIVNCGGASAGDVLALIEMAHNAVAKKFGVELELEIKVLDD